MFKLKCHLLRLVLPCFQRTASLVLIRRDLIIQVGHSYICKYQILFLTFLHSFSIIIKCYPLKLFEPSKWVSSRVVLKRTQI